MGKITFYLSDEVEKRVRSLASEKYGNRRGALSIMAEQVFKEHFRKLEVKTELQK